MLTFTCTNCGAELSVSRIGALSCPHCDSKKFFTDEQLKEYKEFRLKMLEYLSAEAQSEEATEGSRQLWNSAEQTVFKSMDGDDITVEYIYKGNDGAAFVYVARKSVIYFFPAGHTQDAQQMLSLINKVTYPQADMRGLERSFPALSGRFTLRDGGILLVFSKPENAYPAIFFGNLSAKHVEWIISRMENIACVLAYSNLEHGGMNAETLFINPWTHEAILYGGWAKAKIIAGTTTTDLVIIRECGRQLLGDGFQAAPAPLIRFLKSSPKSNAYDDFAVWDDVIETQLGGRHFTKFEG